MSNTEPFDLDKEINGLIAQYPEYKGLYLHNDEPRLVEIRTRLAVLGPIAYHFAQKESEKLSKETNDLSKALIEENRKLARATIALAIATFVLVGVTALLHFLA